MSTSKRIFRPKKHSTKRPTFDSRVLFHRLGILQREQGNIIDEIRHGLPVSVIDNLSKEFNIPLKTFLKYVGLSSTTLVRRRKTKFLNVQESNRVYRIAVAYSSVLELFNGDSSTAKVWLNEPKKALRGSTPLEYLDTEAGLLEIQDLIGRIEHGIIT